MPRKIHTNESGVLPLESAAHQRQGVLDRAAPGRKQPEAFNASSAESLFFPGEAWQHCLPRISWPSNCTWCSCPLRVPHKADSERASAYICFRLQICKSLPLSHYLQICPCNILPIIFTLANHLHSSQQKHPSRRHAWRSVQSQGLEPMQDLCRRLQDTTSLKRDVLRSYENICPSSVSHLFHGEKGWRFVRQEPANEMLWNPKCRMQNSSGWHFSAKLCSNSKLETHLEVMKAR